jgi:hypothetical protein
MITLISFSALLVVGALCMTTRTAQQFFLAANVPVISTHLRTARARRVAHLEHLTGLCEHGYPHEKPIPKNPPPAAITYAQASKPPPGPKHFGYEEYRKGIWGRDRWKRLDDDQDERITRGMRYDPMTSSYRMWTKHKLPNGQYAVTYDDVAAQIVERLLTDEPRWDKI